MRRFALPAIAILALLVPAAGSEAGTYTVRQCHHSAPTNYAHEATIELSPAAGPYAVSAGPGICSGAANDYAIRIWPQADALHGQSGSVRFSAPDGAKLIAVRTDARLRSEQGHRARLSMLNETGAERARFGAGGSEPTGFSAYSWSAPDPDSGGYRTFSAGLFCDREGESCPEADGGSEAKAQVRNLRLTVRDDTAPTLLIDGGLLVRGWLRGYATLQVEALDRGGGLRWVPTVVNGAGVAGLSLLPCQLLEGTDNGGRLSPCPASDRYEVTVDTSQPPFHDGPNELRTCASDFGTGPNATCESATVEVDNTAPALAFADAEDPEDPELVVARARDETSGLDGGSAFIALRPSGSAEPWLSLPTKIADGAISARVDSASLAPGEYELRAEVADRAGNVTLTEQRAGGAPMRLELPLKEGVTLSATLGNGGDDQVVGYREEGTVEGRLLDAGSRPIAGQTVQVVERFEDGALIARRERSAITDAAGRFRSALPGGPSRDVEVHYGGSRRYSPGAVTGLDFDVRGAAQLRLSRRRVRAGRAVRFLGQVRRYYARVPPGGKLVEVQVKSGHRWSTLQEATGTDAEGRVRLRHRFRGFYTRPVTFTFRLKATRENGWPYHGAATSRRRRVTVVPKRRRRAAPRAASATLDR